MEKLLKKLHSQRGETMLMALLLFLVGVMVSAVILAAAISAESDAKADSTTAESPANTCAERAAETQRSRKSILTNLFTSFAKSAFTMLIIHDGFVELLGRELGPQAIGKI